MHALTFRLGEEILAIEAGHVREILDPVPVTVVPNASDLAAGLVNVRGSIVPLADPRVAFGMPLAERTSDTRIVVTEFDIDGEAVVVGILADQVHDVSDIETGTTAAVPSVGLTWPPEYVRSIGRSGEHFVLIPDLPAILFDTGGSQTAANNR
ncbi:MAG: chemotaxis protein CheW [Fulvimarina manganoxydans]|nr:chemotaxis protein CheW [Fulvimarina manganoxydans]